MSFARGIPVVMGGFHATLQTEEALKHADAVVGRADRYGAPSRLAGRQAQAHLQGRQAARPEEPAARVTNCPGQPLPVQGGARAGEPRMSVSLLVLRNPVFYEGSYRTRPIEDIVEEIKQVIAVTAFAASSSSTTR
jgi:hypothetical protein